MANLRHILMEKLFEVEPIESELFVPYMSKGPVSAHTTVYSAFPSLRVDIMAAFDCLYWKIYLR